MPDLGSYFEPDPWAGAFPWDVAVADYDLPAIERSVMGDDQETTKERETETVTVEQDADGATKTEHETETEREMVDDTEPKTAES